jgi:hypothetical protein
MRVYQQHAVAEQNDGSVAVAHMSTFWGRCVHSVRHALHIEDLPLRSQRHPSRQDKNRHPSKAISCITLS